VRGLASVSYSEVIHPARWHEIRESLGNLYIREAREALEKSEIIQAQRLYKVGVARAPGNAQGRIGLAQIYVAFRRPDLAQDTLLDGLKYLPDDIPYLSDTLKFMFDFKFDSDLDEVCRRQLLSAHADVRQLAATYAASLALQRGDFDGAEALIVAQNLERHPEASLILARADLERGYPELAQARLDMMIDSGVSAKAALSLLAEVQQRTGRTSESGLNFALRLADDPLSHQPRIARLQHLAAQHDSALNSQIDNYLNLFPNDQPALLALGDFAANNGLPAIARRIQAIFIQHNWPPDAPSLLFAEACIRAGSYAEGMAELDRYLQENPSWATRYGPAIDALRTVALYGLNRNDDARLQLEHLLGQPNLRADNLLIVSERLLALGRADAARLALSRIADFDPKNQAALAALVRLEAEQGYLDTLPAHLVKFLAVRRPSQEVLSIAYRRIGSDLNLFQPDQQRLLGELRQRLSPLRPTTPRS